MSKIALHVITMNREDELARLLGACQPYVDVMRVCGGGNGYSSTVCETFGAEYYHRQWDDDYSAQDNILLDEAEEGEWILVMDDDEMPSQFLLEHLQELITNVDYDMVRIPSLDIIDGAMMCSVENYLIQNDQGEFDKRFRKDWLFRYYLDMYMEGTPHRSPHKSNGSDWVRHDTGYPYFHIKSSDSFIVNDCTHAFINPEQQGYSDAEAKEMHKFCKKAGIENSVDIIPFLKYGDISKEFRSWMWRYANEDKPIAAWFASRLFLYRPDLLHEYSLSDILTSGAMLRFAELKSCYTVSNIRTIHIHPLLKQLLMSNGIYHTDDIRALHGKRNPVREELPIEIESKPETMESMVFVPNKVAGVLDKPEFPIPVENVLDRKFRDDEQDNPGYWNQDGVVNNDSAKEFDVEVHTKPNIDNMKFWNKYGQPETILEFGCGGGRKLAEWVSVNLGVDVIVKFIGIDHSEKALEKAKGRLPMVSFYLDIYDIPKIGKRPDLIYTHTCLQHNSDYKQKQIFLDFYNTLAPKGILYLMNEMTFSQHRWPDHVVEPQHMSPWFADDRGSGGTAVWWIARICDAGFELLEYNESRYVFRKIARVE